MKWKSIMATFLVVVICGFSVICVYVSPVQAATTVSGVISSDTTWTKINSPYDLTGNVLINNDVTLTVMPGVVVNLNSYYIMVNGTIVANGDSADPITFNDGQITVTKYSNGWDETTSTGCIIQYADINTPLYLSNSMYLSHNTVNRYIDIQTTNGKTTSITNNTLKGGISTSNHQAYVDIVNNIILNWGVHFTYSVAIDAGGSDLTLSNNTISGCSMGVGAFLNGAVAPVIENNLIINNSEGIAFGSTEGSEYSGPIVRNNTIANNTVGISITARGLSVTYTLLNNNIYQNTLNLENQQAGDSNVPNNWWGTTESEAISQSIYDFNDDFTLGRVNFVPFLTAPNENAPSYTVAPSTSPSPTPIIPEAPSAPLSAIMLIVLATVMLLSAKATRKPSSILNYQSCNKD